MCYSATVENNFPGEKRCGRQSALGGTPLAGWHTPAGVFFEVEIWNGNGGELFNVLMLPFESPV